MSDDEFVIIIREALRRTPIKELAGRLRVSAYSIQRWSQRSNLPHEAVREGIARGVAEGNDAAAS